jgi:hypothetical protein
MEKNTEAKEILDEKAYRTEIGIAVGYICATLAVSSPKRTIAQNPKGK